jgi:AcrR family transcriptional regulator
MSAGQEEVNRETVAEAQPRLSPGIIKEHQRRRILQGLAELVAEQGYEGTKITDITGRARVARHTLYEVFDGKEEMLIAAFDAALAELTRRMQETCPKDGDPEARTEAALEAFLGYVAESPKLAYLCLTEAASATSTSSKRYQEALRGFSEMLQPALSEIERVQRPPTEDGGRHDLVAEEVIGGLARIVSREVDIHGTVQTENLLPELVGFMKGFLGPAFETSPPDRVVLPTRSSKTESRPELAKLPPGRHGLPREFVFENQRSRLIAGIADSVAVKGFAKTTIADITRAAAVSRRTFYEHYSNKDEAFVDAYEMGMGSLREQFSKAFDAEDDWPGAIKAGMTAMLELLSAEPNLAGLCFIEAPAAGPIAVERHNDAIQVFAPYFQKGREASETTSGLPTTTEEGLVGGMIWVISRHIAAGRTTELEKLLPELVQFVLSPYLDSTEAAEIAHQGDP